MEDLRNHVVALKNYRVYLGMLIEGARAVGNEEIADLLTDIVIVYDDQIEELDVIINRVRMTQLN